MLLAPYVTVKSQKAKYEVADVFRAYGDEYRRRYALSGAQARVMQAIARCRTAALGGHIKTCFECGAVEVWYNSCRDRHCPKCEKFRKAQWLEKQKVVLLPIPYFHVTFTTDHAINKLVAVNRRLLYDLLFEAASETLKEFGARYLGGELGFTAVLHTWGQKLDEHVHLHVVVTGGALSLDGQRWQASRGKFLFPIVELSAAYRDRFCQKLRQLSRQGKLKLVGQAAGLDVEALVDEMQAKNWEVFANPFAGPEAVYEYLSRYVHQVAISNYRVVKIEQGRVSFTYRDNKDGGQEKVLTLEAVEFIRRFLWHVLPDRFHRIRHYGLHHSSARQEKLPRARQLLGLSAELPEPQRLSLHDWLESLLGAEDLDRCPNCGRVGSMYQRGEFESLNRLWRLLFQLLGLGLYGTVKT